MVSGRLLLNRAKGATSKTHEVLRLAFLEPDPSKCCNTLLEVEEFLVVLDKKKESKDWNGERAL